MTQFKPFAKPARKGANPQDSEEGNGESVVDPGVEQSPPSLAEGGETIGVDPGRSESEMSIENPTRCEVRQTRVAVLTAAAEFLGQLSRTRDDVRSDHVLMLAERWLAWVNQNDE
jgi:hypothetical protein